MTLLDDLTLLNRMFARGFTHNFRPCLAVIKVKRMQLMVQILIIWYFDIEKI